MRRFVAIALAASVLVPIASCGEEPPDPFDAAACEKLRNDPETADAFDWLKRPAAEPKRPGSLSPEEALALAHKFEARGAVRLFAVGNRTVDPDDKGSVLFSRGLLVELPDEPAKRFRVFKMYADQVRNNGYRPGADTGQKYLFVGWPRS